MHSSSPPPQVHAPWCTNHTTSAEFSGDDWCRSEEVTLLRGNGRALLHNGSVDGNPAVDLALDGDLTLAQVRELARTLLQLVEAAS